MGKRMRLVSEPETCDIYGGNEDDVKKLVASAAKHGATIGMRDAYVAWCRYSGRLCASWLLLDSCELPVEDIWFCISGYFEEAIDE